MLLVSIITCFYFLYNFREEEDVPLLIPEEVRRTLEYLSNKSYRKKGGIKEDNPFIFANTGNLNLI
jgi:hypothetical protein